MNEVFALMYNKDNCKETIIIVHNNMYMYGEKVFE